MNKACFIIFSFLSTILSSQKYDFINFTIEHGLIQSQVNNIVQDREGLLWISTLGGISRFDGKEFNNYNFGKGLLHSFTQFVLPGQGNIIWIGSNEGIQSYDGRKFTSYQIHSNGQRNGVAQICQASDQTVYILLNDHKIYKFDVHTSVFEPIIDTLDKVTAISVDTNTLYAAVFKKGIFRLEQDHWKKVIAFRQQDTLLNIRSFVRSKYTDGMYILSTTKLFWFNGDSIRTIALPFKALMLCVAETSPQELCIGTLKGAYKFNLKTQASEYLGRLQGLSDNSVNDIFVDREGNTWFGTNGNGIFRYHDRSFTIYDQSTGLHGNIVMALAKDPIDKTIWAGTLEGGLNKINQGIITKVNHPESDKINCLTFSHDGALWIGTIDNGLWKYHHGRFSRIGKNLEQFPHSFTSIEELSDHSIWITSNRGVLRINPDNSKIDFVPQIKNGCFSIYELNKDSIVVGSSNGLRIVHKDLSATPWEIDGTGGFVIGFIKPWRDFIIFGTSENGLIFWNKSTMQSFVCNEKNGLTSNMTFSMLVHENEIYTGTINGLNKINVSSDGKYKIKFNVTPISSSNQKLGPECNQNSILKDANGTIWLGTTNGIYLYDPGQTLPLTPPKIFLKSIDIFSRPLDSVIVSDSLHDWLSSPSRLVLRPGQNHITFNVSGLQLSAPEKIKYQYNLIGADTTYTEASPTSTVIYPTLAPGQYTFKARALIEAHPTIYSDELSYSFFINPPFYQKNWFRLTFIAALLLIGALIQQYRIVLKERQLRLVDEVRKQEQIKIQERTSEDLHDDLGNKITRLSLLTDILQTKMHPDEDQKKLMSQIRENIQGLYMGTKDIIWALAPNHNSLADALQRINNFGSDLFQDSVIQFRAGTIDPSFKALKPPFEFSRNLIMISKEALHNILKHSEARNASFECTYPTSAHDDPGTIRIEIKDDGIGLNQFEVNRQGNGLDNMRKRIERIGGTIQFQANIPCGTRILLEAKIPQSVG
jgi:ligand-binding sensor domain-containing protein/signal transduction histidine kinase